MKDLMYLEEQRRQQIKVEEEKMLAQEVEQQRRRETPGTWEHYKARRKETNKHAREADIAGMTSETWPPPGNFPLPSFQNLIIHCNSCLKSLTSAFVIFLL
jgi:hypothetical protein